MQEEEKLVSQFTYFENFGKNHQPIHSFYRFKIYEVGSSIGININENIFCKHYQIQGEDLKVIVRFSFKDQIWHVNHYRSKRSDAELARIVVLYWTKFWKENLRPEKFGVNECMVKIQGEI